MLKFLVPLFIPFLCAFAAWPAYFVPNMGQWEGEFAYRCDVGNASYWITSSGMTIAVYANDERRSSASSFIPHPSSFLPAEEPVVVRGHALMMRFVNANPCFELVPDELLSSYSNYFKGRDSCQWHSRVPNYQRVIAKEVWPGIDVEYRADQRGVETVFRVQPRADLSRIVIEYEGLDAPLRLDGQGNLVLTTSVGELHEQAPFAFQNNGRVQKSVPTRYSILSDNRYGFACEDFDKAKELVIDPLLYSTFIAGSTRDTFLDMTKDSSGNKLVCGDTWRSDFPTTPGAFQEQGTAGGFIMKFTPLADSLTFSTYVSGGGGYVGRIRTLADESIFFVSEASENFPLTENAFDTSNTALEVGFIHLASSGDSLLYGSYLGGTGSDWTVDCDIDSLGNVYLYGDTWSPDFPVTPNALYPNFQPYSSLFVSIFNPLQASVIYSTYVNSSVGDAGHWGLRISVVAPGRIWLTVQLSNSGYPTTPEALMPECPGSESSYFGLLDINEGAFLYGSYLGGQVDQGADMIFGIMPIGIDRLWLVGNASDPDFPMPEGGFDTDPPQQQDGFVLVLQLPSQLLHGTFLGGSDLDYCRDLSMEPSGSVILFGDTRSADFPVTPDAFDTTLFTGIEDYPTDAFLCRFSPNLSTLEYGTYIGGEQTEYATTLLYDDYSAVWLGGETYSDLFPITPDAMFPAPSSGFMLRFGLPPQSATPFTPLPSTFAFSTYPNPFNPTTTLVYSLPHPSRVILDVFNTLGQQVKRVDMGRVSAGDHRFLFSADDLPTGTYFARLGAGEFSRTRKMMVVK